MWHSTLKLARINVRKITMNAERATILKQHIIKGGEFIWRGGTVLASKLCYRSHRQLTHEYRKLFFSQLVMIGLISHGLFST